MIQGGCLHSVAKFFVITVQSCTPFLLFFFEVYVLRLSMQIMRYDDIENMS